MARRRARNVTNIRGTGQVDPAVVWRVFECSAPGCDHLHKLSEDVDGFPDVRVVCPKCGHATGKDHILRAPRWKYCRVCEWLQPIGETVGRGTPVRGKTIASAFDYHAPNSRGFRSERQLECKTCKREINRILNPKRTADQHREAARRRHISVLVSGAPGKLDSRRVFERFGGSCFRCGKPLTYKARGPKQFTMDHTLPALYFWPLKSMSATLLCRQCNAEKSDRWPSEYYSREDLQRLSVLTSLPFDLLAGPPKLNPDAVRFIRANVDSLLVQLIRYPAEIRRIRDLILRMEGNDIKEGASTWPSFLD